MRAGLALTICAAVLSYGATTATWELDGYQDFLRGKMSGLSVTPDGHLTLGLQVSTLYASDQQQIWSAAQAPDGSLYLGTGNRGRLIKVDASGKGAVLWTADQPEIFAVTVDRAGVVYAGTSPDGKVYRIENGRAVEYFAPGERYIWALAFAPDGSLYVATGEQGKIFRVTPGATGRPATGALYYETGQTHVTALAFDREGRLLAGSEPNGILYRITGTPAKAFVLYDTNLPEIRAIVPSADGSIYAAALGGSVARRTGAAASAIPTSGVTVVAPATSITVTDTQSSLAPPPKPETPKPTAASASTVTTAASSTEISGVERSALYKISPDNTVETLWTSKEENIYDVAGESSGTLLFLTDAQGRVYRLDPRASQNHSATLLAQANEGDATRLMMTPSGGLLAAAGSAGKILRLGAGTDPAWFESPVHDVGTVARWGRISWLGTTNQAIAFKTRSGNSARPDATWSDWSDPITDPAKSAIASPNARYIQWRAEFTAARPAPDLDSVTLAYLPQNTPPTVRSIGVSTLGAAKSAASAASSSAAFSVTVTDTPDAATTLSRPAGQQIQVSWQADDPEGDKLSFSLYFRGEDEREWKLLRANMTETVYLLEGDVFADGRYFFKVTASDRPSNPPDQAKQSELVSAPVLFDNTPPEVKAALSGNAITVDAEDRTSPLKRCEYSIDAQPWLPVEASDGVTDSPRERFIISLPSLPAGEHVVVIRVYDTAGNAGLAKVVLR